MRIEKSGGADVRRLRDVLLVLQLSKNRPGSFPSRGEPLPSRRERLPSSGGSFPSTDETSPSPGERLPFWGEGLPSRGQCLPSPGESLVPPTARSQPGREKGSHKNSVLTNHIRITDHPLVATAVRVSTRSLAPWRRRAQPEGVGHDQAAPCHPPAGALPLPVSLQPVARWMGPPRLMSNEPKKGERPCRTMRIPT
jgi:hypothetical protein